MEYKSKEKEETIGVGQGKESRRGKVNNAEGNESKRPGRGRSEEADNASEEFPSFSVLTTEERLAFFEALSAARKNVERRGVSTRERFGTVHDGYLEYFTQDEDSPKKPQTASSARPTRTSRGSPTKPTTPDPKPVSPPPQKPPKRPPLKTSPRTRTEAITNCESLIKKDTDKIISMYLDKKKRIEEQWKKSALPSAPQGKTTVRKTPPGKNREPPHPQSGKAVARTPDPKPETSGRLDNPQFRALSAVEREEFMRTLKDAHANILEKNPQKKNAIPDVDEVLKAYGGGRKVTTVCAAVKDGQKTKDKKNLRVKVTLTSGDNRRLSRSRSQILEDGQGRGLNGRSRSLESMWSEDTIQGKQSKIPVPKQDQRKRTLQEEDEDNCDEEDSISTIPRPSEITNVTARQESEDEITILREPMTKIVREKTRSNTTQVLNANKPLGRLLDPNKPLVRLLDPRGPRASPLKESLPSEEACKNANALKTKAMELERRKLAFKKSFKEKERRLAEAAKKEMEQQMQKKKEEWLRRRRIIEMYIPDRKNMKRSSDKLSTLNAGKNGTKEPPKKAPGQKNFQQKRTEREKHQLQVSPGRKVIEEGGLGGTMMRGSTGTFKVDCMVESVGGSVEIVKEGCSDSLTAGSETDGVLTGEGKRIIQAEEEFTDSVQTGSEMEGEFMDAVSTGSKTGEGKRGGEGKTKSEGGGAGTEETKEKSKTGDAVIRRSGVGEACTCEGKTGREVAKGKCEEAVKVRIRVEGECVDSIETMRKMEGESMDVVEKSSEELGGGRADVVKAKSEERGECVVVEVRRSEGGGVECPDVMRRRSETEEVVEKRREVEGECIDVLQKGSEVVVGECEELVKGRSEIVNPVRTRSQAGGECIDARKGKSETGGVVKGRSGTGSAVRTRSETGEGECVGVVFERSVGRVKEEWMKGERERKKEEGGREGSDEEARGKERSEREGSAWMEVSVRGGRSEGGGGSEGGKGGARERTSSVDSESSSDVSMCSDLGEGWGRSVSALSEVKTLPSFVMREEEMTRSASQPRRSLSVVSLVEEKYGEVGEEKDGGGVTGKVILVDDSVIARIKNVVQSLENKVNPKENLENEYVGLMLGYAEYLTRVMESLLRRWKGRIGREVSEGRRCGAGGAKKSQKAGLFPIWRIFRIRPVTQGGSQQVHSTYTAHDVHLKFQDPAIEIGNKEPNKTKIPRSISDEGFNMIPGTSGIEKKRKGKAQMKTPSLEFVMMSDSESFNSETGSQVFTPSSFRKTGIHMTKIRLLQDLLKGRARFVRGSIDDFKIVHYPELEYIPTEKPRTAKELQETEDDQVEKVIRLKFFRNLMKLCNCGRKQVEEEVILENLKGEAVRVDISDKKKDPARATLNQSTMDVLSAADRKRIIDKYFKF